MSNGHIGVVCGVDFSLQDGAMMLQLEEALLESVLPQLFSIGDGQSVHCKGVECATTKRFLRRNARLREGQPRQAFQSIQGSPTTCKYCLRSLLARRVAEEEEADSSTTTADAMSVEQSEPVVLERNAG